MMFVLVKTADDRFPGWSRWRATSPSTDMWFFMPSTSPIEEARAIVRDKFPDATFTEVK